MKVDPLQILLVEDSPSDVLLTRHVLEANPVANLLYVAENGEQALDYLRGKGNPRPDLILLDLNMPRMSGYEVLEELKADPELQIIPVVVLTTSDADQDVLRSYELAANCYVTKPVDLDRFNEVIQDITTFWMDTATVPPDS